MSTLRARALQVQRQEWALSLEQPFMLLTCDGCGHCGAGVGVNQSVAIVEQMVSYLTGWGIAARTPHYYESSSHDEYENPQRAQWRARGGTVYPADDPNIYYSPYNWHVSPTSAATINAGAYVRFLVSGSFLRLQFDVSHMVTPASEIYWRVDNGPATLSLVLDTVVVTFPANNTKATVPFHSIELFVKSTTERANRWVATAGGKPVPGTRIVLTGLETDGQLAPWLPSDVNLLIYGDSITEGVMTLGGSQHDDTDHNDASVVYSHALGRLLGAETGVVGFGDNAFTHTGSGGVPILGEAWDQMWDGVPRNFAAPPPDLIVMNEGTNDGCDTTKPGCVGVDITAPMAAVLTSLMGACPGTPIVVLLPFNGGQAAHILAAIRAVGSPDAIHYVNTTGFYDLKYGGALHPTGPNDVARIAPRIARRLRPILAKRLLVSRAGVKV